MRGYATANGSGLFDVGPVDGETKVVAGVPCTFQGGVYAGSRDGLTVTAHRSTGGAWVVRVVCSSTVLVDDLDAAVAA